MKVLGKILGLGLLTAGLLLGQAQPARAEIALGSAVIQNGDLARARREARNDALRTYLEKAVGVHVSSTTETSLGMVISDRIVATSDGYVQIKRVLGERRNADVLTVSLDLEADYRRIDIALTDLKNRVMMLERDSSRNGISVAVTEGSTSYGYEGDMTLLNAYVQCALEELGFRTKVNDTVRAYMQHKSMRDPKVSAMARAIGRNSRGANENALLRGTMTTLNIRPVTGGYAATVTAAFELTSYDNDDVNSYVENVTMFGSDEKEALDKACSEAARLACENLGTKALRTLQSPGLDTIICVGGISDQRAQKGEIISALTARNVETSRTFWDEDGRLLLSVYAPSYSSLEDLKNDLLNALPELNESGDDIGRYGSTRITLTF